MNDYVLYTLIAFNIIFFLSVSAYYLNRMKKGNKVLHDKFIVGQWQRKGTDEAGNSWYIRYSFGPQNDFSIDAQPSLQVKGKYKLIKEIENLLMLQLYQLEGDTEGVSGRLGVGIDKRANQIIIDNRTFERLTS